jgi:hypothetical protein
MWELEHIKSVCNGRFSHLFRRWRDWVGISLVKCLWAAKGGRVEHDQNTGNERSGIIQELIFDLNLEFGLLITNFFLRSLSVNLPQDLSRLEQVSSSKKLHQGADSVGLTGFFAMASTNATPPTNLLCLLTLFANHS